MVSFDKGPPPLPPLQSQYWLEESVRVLRTLEPSYSLDASFFLPIAKVLTHNQRTQVHFFFNSKPTNERNEKI